VLSIALALMCLHQTPPPHAAAIVPAHLRCEYQVSPLAVDAAAPVLSWALRSLDPNARGLRQEGFQVLVASSLELLDADAADIEDSGRVNRNRLRWALRSDGPLQSGQRVWWKVRVWEDAERVSEWSETAWFETGLLQSADWQGEWIEGNMPQAETEEEFYEDRPAPLLRKQFVVAKPVKRARLYVSGLGFHELYLDGQRVGDQIMDPGWTSYEKRVLYSAYDVTAALQAGEHALGILLGNGWYNPLPSKMWNRFNLREALPVGAPRAILQLNIEYEDGTKASVFTDETWRTTPSPLLWNDIYLGTRYDARRELPGWAQAGFDDSDWQPVKVAEKELGALEAQTIPPMRVTQTLAVQSVTEPQPGVFILDFGQNFSGRVRIRCEGAAGTNVQLRYGELLYPDGTLNAMTTVWGQMKNRDVPEGSPVPRTAWQQDTYTLKGSGPEEYAPSFTYHGFRYVEVTGYPGAPRPENFTGEWIHTDLQQAGGFECSNDLFNNIYAMTMKTLLNNVHSVQTDCPHREKFGYGGDIVASSEMALYNFDMAAFYRKVVRDFADAQRENGGFTETAPYVGIADAGLGDGSGPIGWGTAHPLLLAQLYQWYGDVEIIDEQWQNATRWIALIEQSAKEHLLDNGIGDHESLVDKDTAVSGTAFYYANLLLMGMLNLAEDAEYGRQRHHDLGGDYRELVSHYEDLRTEVREAFIKRFIAPETGKVGIGTQANQAFALYWFWLGDLRAKVLDYLIKDVEAHDFHLTTGIFGTKYMLDVLPPEVAFKVVSQRDFPSWGHMLDEGATTLWEHWEFSDNTFSHNHPMFGSVCDWFARKLAGLSLGAQPSTFKIAPSPCGDVTWARAWHDAPAGRVEVAWRIEGGQFLLDLVLPPNTRAVITFPQPPDGVADVLAVTESGVPLKDLAAQNKQVIFPDPERVTVASGSYHFAMKWPSAK
jgi:alpha-L-rhamnosidase